MIERAPGESIVPRLDDDDTFCSYDMREAVIQFEWTGGGLLPVRLRVAILRHDGNQAWAYLGASELAELASDLRVAAVAIHAGRVPDTLIANYVRADGELCDALRALDAARAAA